MTEYLHKTKFNKDAKPFVPGDFEDRGRDKKGHHQQGGDLTVNGDQEVEGHGIKADDAPDDSQTSGSEASVTGSVVPSESVAGPSYSPYLSAKGEEEYPFPTPEMFPMLLNVSNIPDSIDQHEFIDVLESEFEVPASIINVVNFQNFSYYDPESDQESTFNTALVQIGDYSLAEMLVDELSGFLLQDHPLEVNLLPMFYPMNYYYYPLTPMSSSPLTPGSPMYSKYQKPYGAGSMPLGTGPPGTGHPGTSGAYKSPALSMVPGLHHQFGQGYHIPSMPQIPQMSSMPPMGQIPGQIPGQMSMAIPPIQRVNSTSHIQRSSPSNTTRSSTTPSRTSSISSRASSTSTPTNKANQSGIPQFLMNFVQNQKRDQHEILSQGIPGHQEKDLNFVVIDDEDGNPIRVNPCRLFVGNIPFSSTWSNLKSFLVSKSHEFEPETNIDILRVEIPMHANSVGTKSFNFNYQTKDLDGINEAKEDMDPQDPAIQHIDPQDPQDPQAHQEPHPSTGTISPMGSMTPNGPGTSHFSKPLSRGFAIVTTGNQETSEKIIKYFDGIDFEGRNLTVRFDKFPEFNNYVLQQLYPSPLKEKNTLSNLAFERNSFQQKFYYGNMNYDYQNRSHSYSGGYGGNYSPSFQKNMYYGYNYNRSGSYSQGNTHNPNHNPNHTHTHNHNQRSFYKPDKTSSQSPRFPVIQPNFVPQIHPSLRYINNLNTGKPKKKETEENSELNEDEKARDLVNSFKSLGISSN